MKKMIAIGAFVILGVVAAFGQDQTPRVDARRGAERARIREGRATGEITDQEARRLNAQQGRIRRTERRAKADGDVTVKERRKLNREQNRASRNIRRQKNDAQAKPN